MYKKYTQPTQVSKTDFSKICVTDIIKNETYFLTDFFDLEIDFNIGEIKLSGKIKSISQNQKSAIEEKAEKIKQILQELSNYV